MISFFKYCKGSLRIRVRGFSPERFMNLCSNRGILLWDIVRDGEVYYMNISIKGFYQLRPIVKKTGTRAVILEKYGLPFFLPRLVKRKMFLAGMILAACFWIWSSFYIWDVEVSGNYQITEDMFAGFLKRQNVAVGMPQSALDIEELEKEVRRAFPQVTWTSARLEGTRLKIDVKENDAPIHIPKTEEEGGKDLVAEYEGTIVSMIVRKGVPKVKIGDAVEKGTVLVEGRIPVFNEDATVREYHYVQADADIVVEHQRNFQERLPFDYIKKKYTGRTGKCYFLRAGEWEWKTSEKRPFLIYDSVIRQTRPLLFEKMSIPFYFGSYTHREYQNKEYEYTPEEAQGLLQKKLMTFLEGLDEKGVQIIEKNVRIDTDGGMWVLKGDFLVREKFGKSVDTAVADIGAKEQNE